MLVTYPLYVLREFGKAFGIFLLIYTFAFLAIYCGQALREGATLITVFSLMPRLFPLISPLALPLSVITGILISYGKLAENNEIVGAQASGVHPFWTAIPALIVSILCSVITVYLNADILTSSVASIERSLLADRAEIIRSRLTKPGSFSFPISHDKSLTISRLPVNWNIGNGVDFSFYRKPETGSNQDTVSGWDPNYPFLDDRILSRNHKIEVFEDENGTMFVRAQFENGSETMYSGTDIRSFLFKNQDKSVVIPKDGIRFSIKGSRTQYMGIDKLRLNIREAQQEVINILLTQNLLFDEYIPEFINQISTAGNKISPAEAHQLKTKWEAIYQADDLAKTKKILSSSQATLKADPSSVKRLLNETNEYAIKNKLSQKRELFINIASTINNSRLKSNNTLSRNIRTIDGYVNALKNSKEKILHSNAELNVKLVMSFACISFAIIGIPIGLMSKKGSSMLGCVIGSCFAFGFYMVITALHGAVRDGSIAWWGLWVPNLLVLIAGIFLWNRSIKTIK